MPNDITNFDPFNANQLGSCTSAFMEKMIVDNWTLDPAIYDYRARPNVIDYMGGQLAENWEFTDPSTLVFHLRKGINWQNIPPLNGREFVANDVIQHFQRLYGLGSGRTPSPFQYPGSVYMNLTSMTAPDKYTVVSKWNTQNSEYIIEAMMRFSGAMDIEAPEIVAQYGDVNDWHHAVGTGPFIMNDFVSGASTILVRNPNYWGYDERNPKNRLPYIDRIRILIIPNEATAMAALRSGKIDAMDQLSMDYFPLIKQSNPEIIQISLPASINDSITPRIDVKPFDDIRVRKAMQMALDLPTLAKTYYHGLVPPYPASITSNEAKEWGFPYDQWPQALKDEYAYNPTAAKKLLADAGYPTGFKTNVVANTLGDMDLLQIVKAYFLAVGIDMEIRQMDNASWLAFVQNAKKEDQMTYGQSSPLGQVSEPLSISGTYDPKGITNYGMVNDPTYNALLARIPTETNFANLKQIIRDMAELVARQHYAISMLAVGKAAFKQPWLNGYIGQFDSVSGGKPGPHLLGFFGARFWIDQDLKKSMGH
jgi:peptide/nickel transport system substrate-binding protein